MTAETKPELRVLSFPKPARPKRRASGVLRARLREHIRVIRAVAVIERYCSGADGLAEVLDECAARIERVRGRR